MQGWRDLTFVRVVRLLPFVFVGATALEFICGGGGSDATVSASVLWQTVIIHVMGFGAALWVIRTVSRWTAAAGGTRVPDGEAVVGSQAVAATVIAYGVVDAVQLAVKTAIPTASSDSALGPGAQFPSAIKSLVTTSLYEEATFAAIPAVAAGWVLAVVVQRGRDVPWVRASVIAAFVTAGGILRGAIHWYQGPANAAIAVAWGAATVLIYWRWRSILGLVLVHSWYNSAMLVPEDHWVPYAVVSWVVLVGAAGLVCVRGRAESGVGLLEPGGFVVGVPVAQLEQLADEHGDGP